MAKFKLTKNELKKQKDLLKMFHRYLPTLQLKKQQLQIEISQIKNEIKTVIEQRNILQNSINNWISLFAEDIDLLQLISIDKKEITEKNIAGIFVPIFHHIKFKRKNYDLFKQSLWVDKGLDAIEKIITINIKNQVLNEQLDLIEAELQSTSQKVNLFEKVKIPETKDTIKKITIYLGDEQIASVTRGKLAKKKIRIKI